MDTVVYQDKIVAEILKNFICVRINYDKNPELVKKYNVKPLPDVRILDPEGKEISKAVGFVSAAKLASACKSAQERLSGKAAPAAVSAKLTAKNVAVTDENIRFSVQKGVRYLKDGLQKGWIKVEGMGPDDIVLFTFAACGVDNQEDSFKKLLNTVLNTNISSTYQASFRALALFKIDPKMHLDQLKKCAEYFIKTQLSNGQWTYKETGSSERAALGDNSNTAFALLGLAVCKKAGIDIPAETMDKAAKWFRNSQNKDGGWGYRSDRETESYASMTENGIFSLLAASSAQNKNPAQESDLSNGWNWLEQNFSASENRRSAYQEGRLYYHLFAIERLGSKSGMNIKGHDWYRECAAFILGTQNNDGSWDDGSDTPIPNTCFALHALKRATGFLK